MLSKFLQINFLAALGITCFVFFVCLLFVCSATGRDDDIWFLIFLQKEIAKVMDEHLGDIMKV